MSERPDVLCIAMDSAESATIRSLIQQRELPSLARLSAAGRWTRLIASEVGSAAVWPSFLLGQGVERHGIFAEWIWDPSTMKIVRYNQRSLEPFYQQLQDREIPVGTLDVPFDALRDPAFAIREWGAHYVIDGELAALPTIAEEALRDVGAHPYSRTLIRPDSAHDLDGMRATAHASIEGASARGRLAEILLSETKPRLALIAFQESHHAGHFLWHTTSPKDRVYSDIPREIREMKEGVIDVYKAVDKQVGHLIETVRPRSVLVFALNGMEPYRGTPDVVTRMMHKDSYSTAAHKQSGTFRNRTHSLLAYAKDKSPKWIKQLYHRTTSRELQRSIARATLLEPLDWKATRAFSLPPEEHSMVRINLKGRERDGIVEPHEYGPLIAELEEHLSGLVTTDGRSAVKNVYKVDGSRAESTLPDLVVQWHHEATFPSGNIAGFAEHEMLAGHHTGHHRPEGFCISSGPISREMPADLRVEELHQPILHEFENVSR